MKKNTKSRTLYILLGVFTVFILSVLGLMIYTLAGMFSEDETSKNSSEVGFEAIAIQENETAPPMETSEELKQKRLIYEETNKSADNKDISFEVVSKNKKGEYVISEPEKPRTLLDPMLVTGQQQPAKKVQQTSKINTTGNKDEKVINDLAKLYQSPSAQQSPTHLEKSSPKESALERKRKALQDGFSSTTQVKSVNQKNIIYAVVHGTQTIKQNGQILLRITSANGETDDGQIVPKNTLVYGEVSSIKDNRLQISFSSALINGILYPFSYDLFSLDGRSGILITSKKAVEEATEATKQTITNEVRRSTTNMLATAVDLVSDISRSASKENRLQLTLIDNQKFHLFPKQ